MRISQVLPHVATNKPQLNSARPFQIRWTTSPSCNCVLGRSCQFGENGNASKDLGAPPANCMHFYRSHPKTISQGCAPLQQKFLFNFSRRTWALACALAKICLKGKWQVNFQPVCFVACFLTLDTSCAGSLWALVIPLICKSEEPCTCTCLCVSVAGSLNGQRIDNIPCTSYFISKHPSWSRQTKQTCQKSTDWPHIPESKGCEATEASSQSQFDPIEWFWMFLQPWHVINTYEQDLTNGFRVLATAVALTWTGSSLPAPRHLRDFVFSDDWGQVLASLVEGCMQVGSTSFRCLSKQVDKSKPGRHFNSFQTFPNGRSIRSEKSRKIWSNSYQTSSSK